MYKVKFTPYRKDLGDIMLRQTKDGKGISSDGRYKFYINEDSHEADFWVVQGKGIRKKETCRVAPENTLLLTTEPRSVLVYPKSYIKQFGAVFTNQEYPKHKNQTFGPAILPWFVGNKKTKVLKEYNIFDHVAGLCDRMDPTLPKEEVTLKPCRSTDDWYNVYNYTIKRSLFKLKYKIKELFRGSSVLHHKKH